MSIFCRWNDTVFEGGNHDAIREWLFAQKKA